MCVESDQISATKRKKHGNFVHFGCINKNLSKFSKKKTTTDKQKQNILVHLNIFGNKNLLISVVEWISHI